MNFLKILGGLIILLTSSYIGFSSAANINQEVVMLRKLLHALDYMSCELQYKLTPLPELCRSTSNECSGKLKRLFQLFAEELESQVSPDVKSCMNAALSKITSLPSQTVKTLIRLGSSMGRFDLQGQIRGIESVRVSCKNLLDNIENGKESRLRTYRTLGICTGAAMVILFA